MGKFAERLKELRSQNRMTQADLGKLLKVSGAQLTTSFTGSAKKDGDDYKVTNCTLVE